MAFAALDPWTGKSIWRQALTGFYGKDAHVLPQSWHIHEEHMTNNVLTAKGDAVRLDDEFGTWQFSVVDGRIEGRSHDLPQPGWPRGRRTPKDPVAAERWPWSGWDRVSLAEIIAGKDTAPVMAHGMHPGTRAAPKYHWWFFPDPARWGVHAQRLNKEKQFTIEPARFEGDAPAGVKPPWSSRTVDLDAKAYLFAAGGDVLMIGGGTPIAARHTAGRVYAIDMADGKDLASADLPAAVCYDGMAAAQGCLYVATVDGKVYCLRD
jgi:outer membrane protein assembly factor BamB